MVGQRLASKTWSESRGETQPATRQSCTVARDLTLGVNLCRPSVRARTRACVLCQRVLQLTASEKTSGSILALCWRPAVPG